MILVTGASGFIGRHLINELVQRYGGAEVLALSSKINYGCHFLDSKNYTFEQNYFSENDYGDIQTIIHAGAYIPKSPLDANAIYKCNSNITSTTNLIKAKFSNLKRFIFLSTVDVYEKRHGVITEKNEIGPVSLYGYSKLYCEKMISTWADQAHVSSQILRIGHVYGPGEEAYQKLIPTSFKRIVDNKVLKQYGDGMVQRSFIFVKDVVEAIVNAISLDERLGPINVVSGKSLPIAELLKKIIDISENAIAIEQIDWDGDHRDLIFNNSLMLRYLLKKETPIDIGLKEEWEYMRHLK